MKPPPLKRTITPAPKREAKVIDYTPRPRAPAKVAPADDRPVVAAPKDGTMYSQAIRDSARGAECSMRIFEVCNRDPATSVWAHWPGLDGGRGMGVKSIDLAGCVACSACHDVLDGRAPRPIWMSREAVELAFLRAHLRSLVMLVRRGLIGVT